MLRYCLRSRRRCYLHYTRRFFSTTSSSNPVESPNNLNNQHPAPPQSPSPPQNFQTNLSTVPSNTVSLSRNSVLALSATLISAIVASVAVLSANGGDGVSDGDNPSSRRSPLYDSIEHTVQKSNDSFRRILHQAKQTGVAASVLWQSLRSVMSSANHEVRVGFELRVASLLADIAAANASRRAAIVSANGGAVVDWLLETVAVGKSDVCGTQAEAARALAYLIADPDVRKDVLGRPGAVSYLLRFIFSCQPQNKSKRHSSRSSFENSDSLKGRSMLVAAIMDVVTSDCDSVEKESFKPWLPANAEMRDIAAAVQVIEEGDMHLDEGERNDDDDDGGGGMKGIGIKILGGTTALGLSRTTKHMTLDHSDDTTSALDSDTPPKTLALLNKRDNSVEQGNLSAAVVPGLWDDLHSQHVAVPFAAWALANWAMASEINRSHIEELDRDGVAVMSALLAPERSVKWHGSLVARLLLEDQNLPLNDSVSDWASSLLSTASHASKNEDISLSQMALSAFIVAVERSQEARTTVMEKGLELMRVTANRTAKHQQVQEALAKALELLSTDDVHFSIEESQKWSSILLSWVFGKSSSNGIRSSAIRILSSILEDHGPSSVPISQGWLALLLNDILISCKASSVKGGTDKVKTRIDQSNILSAGQTANQLAVAVVNLAGNQLTGSVDTFPLADLLSLEPFAVPYKNLKKDNPPKFDVADSALATLKGIKAMTEICAEDSSLQDKITDLGVLSLLRRYLLRDDYEKLAAIEAYAASSAAEAQERVSNNDGESSPPNNNNPSSVRVPPTGHIRRHAARLLTILSLLPKVQEVIAADKTWCKWLEDCANGKISSINDLKIRSYARAILLNVFCNQGIGINSVNNGPENSSRDGTSICPSYNDMIFLINPELPHWKCPGKDQSSVRKDKSVSNEVGSTNSDCTSVTQVSDVADSSNSFNASNNDSDSENPQLDIVFVHGLRGGPYKTWRISENKYSTKSGLVEKIDEEAGKLGTFWPGEWLSVDFPQARLFSLKYKTNLTQWSGASLPLQEVSSMLLNKLVAAGIGSRPVVFVTHSMGGLVVKQMLFKAKAENMDDIVNNTVGVVFYSCPHFGSKLADMPWRIGLVLRPAPSIGELRSGSPRLVELNDFLRRLHKKQMLQVLSFCETKVTPIVEGYGGWAFRMEIVPIESAYPGFGELVVLESTDHINSCKPLSRSDPSYIETLEFLRKLKARYT